MQPPSMWTNAEGAVVTRDVAEAAKTVSDLTFCACFTLFRYFVRDSGW